MKDYVNKRHIKLKLKIYYKIYNTKLCILSPRPIGCSIEDRKINEAAVQIRLILKLNQ